MIAMISPRDSIAHPDREQHSVLEVPVVTPLAHATAVIGPRASPTAAVGPAAGATVVAGNAHVLVAAPGKRMNQRN